MSEAFEPGTTILVVDDDETLCERLAMAFADRGLSASTAHDADSALSLAKDDPPELAVVDLRMPGRSGLELVRDLVALDAGVQVVVLTGYGSIATAVDAVRLGASEYVTKPADADTVLAAFSRGRVDPLARTGPEYDVPSLARSEWEQISRVMADCGGNVSKAARVLGLHRRTLQRKLQKYPPRA